MLWLRVVSCRPHPPPTIYAWPQRPMDDTQPADRAPRHHRDGYRDICHRRLDMDRRFKQKRRVKATGRCLDLKSFGDKGISLFYCRQSRALAAANGRSVETCCHPVVYEFSHIPFLCTFVAVGRKGGQRPRLANGRPTKHYYITKEVVGRHHLATQRKAPRRCPLWPLLFSCHSTENTQTPLAYGDQDRDPQEGGIRD